MRFLIIIVLGLMSIPTFAQDDRSADALLQEIVSAARAAENWRAEGVRSSETTLNGTKQRQEIRFKVAVQGPSRLRWETSGDDQTTVVCDGTNHWTFYRQAGGGYYRSSIAVSPCGEGIDVGDFLKLTDGLVTATYMGRDHVQFAGALQECLLVRTEYESTSRMSATHNRVIHTFCIDPAKRIVLRQRTEAFVGDGATTVRMTETTTYVRYERDIALPSDTFRFVAPNGATELKGP